MILKIRRSKIRSGSVKLYARVASRTRQGVDHAVGYIRSKNFRGWLCDCEDFFFTQKAKNRNCDHIREVRTKYGRYGARLVG